jgi:hypothetical protein
LFQISLLFAMMPGTGNTMSNRWQERAARRLAGGHEGHTLAEMVVALMLLLTVLIPTGMSLIYAMENRESRNLTGAIVLAQSVMEEFMARACPESSERVIEGWTLQTVVSVQGGVSWYDVAVTRTATRRRAVTLRSAQRMPEAACPTEET